MDQSVLLLIGGLLAIIVAILILTFAIYGFQQSLKETNRKRRDTPTDTNRVIKLPDITTRSSSSGKIEFGEIIEFDVPPVSSIVNLPDPGFGRCAVCRNNFINTNHILCPNCEAEYHDHCFAEYDRVCINCGWRQS